MSDHKLELSNRWENMIPSPDNLLLIFLEKNPFYQFKKRSSAGLGDYMSWYKTLNERNSLTNISSELLSFNLNEQEPVF
ncbi:hypothetical protein, partial [Xanthovirga aplysinae]|uniref:hypothetical protein n=1 Tax=Xanthovirga aplysinae TaxID=2529853 RepID=UPI001CA3C239